MKKYIFIIILSGLFNVHAQNLDSLFNQYVKIKDPSGSAVKGVRTAIYGEHEKCGFGIVNQVRLNVDNFNPAQQKVIHELSNRPDADTSFVSPKGLFRIHYKKDGFDKPGYDLKELAKAADSSYNYEVNILGYPKPPKDNGIGGDDLYDIYIKNLDSYTYGYTEGDVQVGDSTYASFMVMDNDFSTLFTPGINGARVTVAHEFHHAIQMGNYIFRGKDKFFYEITSTAMEESVFDSINDYYYELQFFMNNPQRSFARNNGYNLAIWNIFLKERYNEELIKRIWELMPSNRAMIAIGKAITEKGSSFKNEFALFGNWLFFTGNRALPNKYFKEAKNYPLVKPSVNTKFTKPETMVAILTEAVSTNILLFTDDKGNKVDSFYSFLCNADVSSGVNSTGSVTNCTYYLSAQPGEGYRFIVDGYYSKVESAKNFLFAETNVLNNFLINDGQINSAEIEYAFPQPFRYSIHNYLYFPAPKIAGADADLYIYSADMDLIYSGTLKILALDKVVVQWDVLDKRKNRLNSGVYFYFVKSGDQTKKGKFAILR